MRFDVLSCSFILFVETPFVVFVQFTEHVDNEDTSTSKIYIFTRLP